MLAARIIVAIENPADIVVMSARPYGQRAVFKFAQYTGAKSIAGRHTPGTFTNQIQTYFDEPRLLVLTDPRTDHQAHCPHPTQPAPAPSTRRGPPRVAHRTARRPDRATRLLPNPRPSAPPTPRSRFPRART